MNNQEKLRSGLVICRHRKQFEVEPINRSGIFKCVARSNTGSIVAGDRVKWVPKDDSTGIIESRNERISLLERPDNFGKLKPVAANIDQMLIVIACEPEPQPNLIDRYLVAAKLMNISAVIILNKVDLISSQNTGSLNDLLATYEALGYNTAQVISSRHIPAKLDDLPPVIDNKTSIVVGQSGVGKSSLINKLLPDAGLATGELTEKTREGAHTTTMAKLFHLPVGGQLIDSPGIRDFSLWHIREQELQTGFIEISEAAKQCRFRDCKHESEPNCAVIEAVETNKINPLRFASYLRIKKSMREQQARGLKRNS